MTNQNCDITLQAVNTLALNVWSASCGSSRDSSCFLFGASTSLFMMWNWQDWPRRNGRWTGNASDHNNVAWKKSLGMYMLMYRDRRDNKFASFLDNRTTNRLLNFLLHTCCHHITTNVLSLHTCSIHLTNQLCIYISTAKRSWHKCSCCCWCFVLIIIRPHRIAVLCT